MSEALRAVKGMNDILPPESARWEWFEDKVRALMRRYAYVNVRTPVVEPTALFVCSSRVSAAICPCHLLSQRCSWSN